MDDWDKSWLVDECHLCDICGHQYIHWNGCPNSYSLPPNPYYDSSIICDVGRGDEVENAKQDARNVNSLMECTNMLNKCLNVWKSKEYSRNCEMHLMLFN
ncbi:hypothetical protein R3W88_016430 [Solanum pinnatisectum]|uniref:Uncharacterized protein n=1 Tax=Solanum pinnatisectum TaxID=50273 RepID=A0AAV9L1K1_9SOLN|nr:hypothetical protein R3W88_016430 [Solanum pinnatisectum]